MIELGPSQAGVDDGQALVHQCDSSGTVVGLTEGLEVGPILTGAKPEDEPSIAELVQRGRSLHHQLWAAASERDDRGDEPQSVGPGCHRSQRHEGIRCGTAHRQAEAVPDGKAIPARLFSRTREPDDGPRI